LTRRVNRIGVIEAITSPLGFYVLALLIVEYFLGVLYVKNANGVLGIACLAIGTILFLTVVLIVTHLVIHYPTNLTFKGKDHIDSAKIRGSKGKEKSKETIFFAPKVEGTGTTGE